MSKPTRIQLSRAKGWKMPPNTRKVDRSTRWGNFFKVGAGSREAAAVDANDAVQKFEVWLQETPQGRLRVEDARRDLAGKNLACWCPLGTPCHADVLLRVANA